MYTKQHSLSLASHLFLTQKPWTRDHESWTQEETWCPLCFLLLMDAIHNTIEITFKTDPNFENETLWHAAEEIVIHELL